ncbi:MAG: M36 family metallopeptidase [Nocardioidaceae bacterium]
MGRDNANQITLQDGIPGITNQYLFQPIAGAFYSPCVDGDFDAPVYGHEYTHAITNRMVGGPDGGLGGFQGRSMGESWSDLVALEYLFEHSYDIGTKNPWVEGPYVTGNKTTGIRNYALNKNPLQYGDLGYDLTGAEVHADGEVWNIAMFDVRRELVAKYNAKFPESNKALQLRCADGTTRSHCELAAGGSAACRQMPG